jgi:C-terminal processing protease CtpA/Prc
VIASPFPKGRSGIGAGFKDGSVEIVHVAKNSPAEEVGRRAGDRIVAVDGEPFYIDYVMTRPRRGIDKVGTAYVLTLGDGRTVRIVLRDYF